MEFIEVDGSLGEGGGQILRTAVSFSAILKKPVRVSKIRAGRGVPGLKRQHVSALKVLAEAFDGDLKGATEGSSEVTFVPGAPRRSSLSLDMGTAASITLVLQAVVPAVALSGSSLSVDLVGGTDVPWSPTFDYFAEVVREAFGAVGISFRAQAEERGYYPQGGGRVRAVIEPCPSLRPLSLTASPQIGGVRVLSRCGSLPKHVADRQLGATEDALRKAGIRVESSESTLVRSRSPGSSLLVYSTGPAAHLGADSLGQRGKKAEAVGEEAAQRFAAAADSGACLDSNLADMVLPLLSLASGPSEVRVHQVTPHLESGLRLAAQFTSCTFSTESAAKSPVMKISPRLGQSRNIGHNV
jgi:RNA 3'-phosphate cyclase